MNNLKTKAGQRIKEVRLLFGITQKEFAKLIGIELTRYKSIEILNTRAAEDVLSTVCSLFPNFMAYIIIEGEVSLRALSKSESSYERLAAARFDTRTLPEGSSMAEYLIDDRQEG